MNLKQPITVMIVEDSATMRTMLGQALHHMGYRVIECGTAAGALEQLPELRPMDAVVLDYHLPDQPGIVVARELRRRHEEVVCILVTSDPSEQLIDQAFAAGVDEYVMKPVKPEMLSRLIHRAAARRAQALQRRRAFSSLREDVLRSCEALNGRGVDVETLRVRLAKARQSLEALEPLLSDEANGRESDRGG